MKRDGVPEIITFTLMKIGLVFPNKDRKDKTVHLGLGYIAAYARQHHNDLEFTLLDTRVATAKETKEFWRTPFDLLGITVLSPVYHEVRTIFRHCRAVHPATPIVLGGPYVTTIKEAVFFETPADFAIYGEAEVTFAELLLHLKGEKDIREINGLIYLDRDQALQVNPPREQMESLDELPFPAYDLFRMDRYPLHRIATSRGCPFHCTFCNSASIWEWHWRMRSAENIFAEIVFLMENYRKKPLFFNDNSFNINLERVDKFCDLMIASRMNILWSTPVRAERITPELARKMKKAGCYNVSIGIESANDVVLRNIQKQTTLEKIQKGIEIFKDAGIEVLGQFMIGNEGDNLETIRQSLEFARKSRLDFILFYSALPIPGTAMWDFVSREGRLLNDVVHDYHTTRPRIVFDTPGFTFEERLQAIEMAKAAGYYSDSNDRSQWFDFFKATAGKLYRTLPAPVGEKTYLVMKNLYRRFH